LAHLAWNTAALVGAAFAGKLKKFEACFPARRERIEKPSLEDRIREAWELHGIEPPEEYQHVKTKKR
jgi:hypothetical protein